MERSLHRFVRLLRLRGVRVSVTEALDAMHAVAVHGALADRETLRCVLRVALVKDRRDEELFDELFDRYFWLEPIATVEQGHNHAHDDLADTGTAESFTISPEASQTPQQGHSHGKPADIRDFFRQQDLATAYNLHQEASKIDLASMTDEIVLSKERGRTAASGPRVQLDTSRLHGAGLPGKLQSSPGTRLNAGLTVAEEQALLDWLGDPAIGSTYRRTPSRPWRAGQAARSPTSASCSSATWRRSRPWTAGPSSPRSEEASAPPRSARPNGTGSRRPCAAWPRPCREPSPTGAWWPARAASTPAAPCAPTCASTGSRSGR